MRNLLLLLLLANILYLMWGLFVDDSAEPGVAIVAESELGPTMAVIVNPVDEDAASVGAVLGSGVTVERCDHILAGARRCAYRVEPRTRRRSS